MGERTDVWAIRALAVVLPGLLAWWVVAQGGSFDWRVVVCDVGQGSATVVRGGEQVAVIDAGPDNGRVLDCLADLGVQEVAAVFISHLDRDHVGGLGQLLTSLPVQRVLVSGAGQEQEDLAELAATVPSHVPISVLGAPAAVAVGDELVLRVVWPQQGSPAAEASANDGSLVLAANWPDGAAALIPGDIEAPVQGLLARSLDRAAFDVVVVPHHGSANFDEVFPDRLRPAVAVVSVGADNGYGHPVDRVLATYEAAGAQVWRTDRAGNIALAWNADAVLLDSW